MAYIHSSVCSGIMTKYMIAAVTAGGNVAINLIFRVSKGSGLISALAQFVH